MTMNDAQKIYSYLISEGYTRETKTLSMAVLGNWTIRQNVDTGEKLSTFIQKFPQMFVLANSKRNIYAVVPPGQESIASQYPYTWRREDFQGTYDSPPFDKDVNVAALRRPSPPPSDDDLLLLSTSQRIGGKSKSKSRSRSAKKSKSKSRNARKSRTKKNRNRRNKTARKY